MDCYVDLTVSGWLTLLHNKEVFSDEHLRMVKIIASLPNHEVSAKGLMKAMDLPHYVNSNSMMGRIGRKVCHALGLSHEDKYYRDWWPYVFHGERRGKGKGKEFFWIMPKTLLEAVNQLAREEATSSEKTIKETIEKTIQETTEEAAKANPVLTEGEAHQVTLSYYERNRKARKLCLAHYKPFAACQICGFDFSGVYGQEFEGIVQVHHINPMKDRETPYEIDSINDLIPLCPNCHAALHKKDPPYTPEYLKEKLGIT